MIAHVLVIIISGSLVKLYKAVKFYVIPKITCLIAFRKIFINIHVIFKPSCRAFFIAFNMKKCPIDTRPHANTLESLYKLTARFALLGAQLVNLIVISAFVLAFAVGFHHFIIKSTFTLICDIIESQ